MMRERPLDDESALLVVDGEGTAAPDGSWALFEPALPTNSQ
jgi:hypothetical protein